MKVLYLAQKQIMQPWYDDFLKGIGNEHEVALFDPELPLEPQFEGIGAVVDQGGVVGTREMIDLAARKGAKLYQVIGTGLDHTDVEYIVSKGLIFSNTPGQFSAVGLAEHAMFLMLYLSRRFPETQTHMCEGRRCMPMGDELEGRTLAMIGFGASARELARRAGSFGMRMLAIDAMSFPDSVRMDYGLEFLGGVDELHAILPQADFVSLHTPYTTGTHHLINREALERMKTTVRIINVARGEIIDEAALLEALQTGRIAGAGLDVFTVEPADPANPLLHMVNVCATPHVAGMTDGTSRRRGAAAADNVRRIARGEPVLYTVKSRQ